MRLSHKIIPLAVVCLSGQVSLADPAPRGNGYKGIWFELGQRSAHGDKYSGGLGTYTSSHTPMAVYAPAAKKTFFTYGGTTTKEARHLLIMVSYFDHATGLVPRPVIVHDKAGVNDPHDNASLQIGPDGRVWIYISGRAKSRPGFKYRSTEPYSIDSFERLSEEEMTYPQPWFVEGKGWLHLFTKYTRGRELYWETSADGVTWSGDRKLAGIGGHYQVSGRHGRVIATFFNRHPGGNVDRRTDLYYAQTADFGSTWTSIDGTVLSLPLNQPDNPARVVDYATPKLNMYACDLNFDRHGRPLLLHVTSQGHQPGPANDPRALRLTHWDGKAWNTKTISGTDHNYDMGSVWTGGSSWKVIAPASPGPQPWGGGGEMGLWTSTDEGATWSAPRAVTRNSSRNHNYARRPQAAQDPFFAFWADGNPDEFSESHLYFCDSTGSRVWRLPYDMEGAAAAPVLVK